MPRPPPPLLARPEPLSTLSCRGGGRGLLPLWLLLLPGPWLLPTLPAPGLGGECAGVDGMVVQLLLPLLARGWVGAARLVLLAVGCVPMAEAVSLSCGGWAGRSMGAVPGTPLLLMPTLGPTPARPLAAGPRGGGDGAPGGGTCAGQPPAPPLKLPLPMLPIAKSGCRRCMGMPYGATPLLEDAREGRLPPGCGKPYGGKCGNLAPHSDAPVGSASGIGAPQPRPRPPAPKSNMPPPSPDSSLKRPWRWCCWCCWCCCCGNCDLAAPLLLRSWPAGAPAPWAQPPLPLGALRGDALRREAA